MSPSAEEPRPTLSTAIITAGLIAGTMDILAAFTNFYRVTGKSPIVVLNYISSSLFPKEIAYGGAGMSALGLLMHYMIAFGWTILFFVLYPKLSLLRGNKIVVGLLYGVFVWTMMNLVFVPLTRITQQPFNLSGAVTQCAILMVCIGLPVSIVADRHFSRQ